MKLLIATLLVSTLCVGAGQAQIQRSSPPSASSRQQTPAEPQSQQGWTRQDIGSTDEIGLGGISCLNKDTVLIGSAVGVYRTSDAGLHWAIWPLAPKGVPSFADEKNGIVIDYDGVPLHVYHTSNGGTSWDTSALGMIPFSAVCRVGHDTIFICDGDGDIARSTNGGISWTTKEWAPGGLLGLSFANSKLGYAVGNVTTWFGPPQRPDAANVYVTTDGGESWNAQYSGIPERLFVVHLFDRKHVLVGGQASYVAYTLDGGDVVFNGRWVQDSSGQVQQTSLAISFPSISGGTIVGSSGGIIRTLDSGRTWRKQGSGVHTDLYSVAFTDEVNGFAVGEQNVILHTTNGGMDWVQPATAPKRPLEVVIFPQPSRMFLHLSYDLTQVQQVTVVIYDINGRIVSTLVDQEIQVPGSHKLTLDSSQLDAGVYTYQIQSELYSSMGKITIVK